MISKTEKEKLLDKIIKDIDSYLDTKVDEYFNTLYQEIPNVKSLAPVIKSAMIILMQQRLIDEFDNKGVKGS